MRHMHSLLLLILIQTFTFTALAQSAAREFYELKEYCISSPEQEQRLDQFLEQAYLPALHRAGVEQVGVFKPIASAETAGKVIYVLIPFREIEQFVELPGTLEADAQFKEAGQDVLDAAHNQSAYNRITSTLLQAFELMPQMEVPQYDNAPSERIYELRSYEAATEKLYRKKVKMFNEGGEIDIFEDLGFNAVFYAEVLSGDRMPNLMYMTTFTDMESRDQHWDAFRTAPAWKELSAQEEYKNTVSKSDIMLLHPTAYSDI